MKYFWIFCLFALLNYGNAQNLVPNPSFENYSSCPNSPNITLAVPWTNPTGSSPDYYNECCIASAGFSVPTNVAGFHWARTGKGYAGIEIRVPSWPNARDYIEVALTDSLIKGEKYCVGFYVSLSNLSQYASNSISACLSNNFISCSTICVLPFVPQMSCTSSPISDTLNWVLVSGSFVANGGEKYITIGNFYSDFSTTLITSNPSAVSSDSYYYIDDVYVGSCDTITSPAIKSTLITPNIFTPNNDGQNDVFKIQASNIQTMNCSIYDRWGGRVWELKNPDESWDGHNQTGIPCNDGVYFYILDAMGEEGKAYHQTGFVQLIR